MKRASGGMWKEMIRDVNEFPVRSVNAVPVSLQHPETDFSCPDARNQTCSTIRQLRVSLGAIPSETDTLSDVEYIIIGTLYENRQNSLCSNEFFFSFESLHFPLAAIIQKNLVVFQKTVVFSLKKKKQKRKVAKGLF